MAAHPLDNPIWTALTTTQAHWAQTSALARRFPAEIGPLAGFETPSRAAYESMAELFPAGEIAGICLDAPPELPSMWTLLEFAPLLQMVYTGGELPAPSSEMLALAELTKPGPFALRTHELGDYIGIRREGKLAAMAGERMRAPGYTEVSAICTHPDHLGHGYATGLTVELMRRILARGETPFLHVRTANQRAIELYHRLGYVERYRPQFAVLRKK